MRIENEPSYQHVLGTVSSTGTRVALTLDDRASTRFESCQIGEGIAFELKRHEHEPRLQAHAIMTSGSTQGMRLREAAESS